MKLFIADFQRIVVNQSVLVFDYRATELETVDFVVYDPNDLSAPRHALRPARRPLPSDRAPGHDRAPTCIWTILGALV